MNTEYRPSRTFQKLRRSKQYWDDRKQYYPFQTTVPHMSRRDLDPKKFSRMTNEDFLRVPFNGQAYWGFKTQKCLDLFNSQGGGYAVKSV